MGKGRNNKLAGQIGEYLVCAELGRRDLIATPFSGNVPTSDVLAADEQCRTVPTGLSPVGVADAPPGLIGRSLDFALA